MAGSPVFVHAKHKLKVETKEAARGWAGLGEPRQLGRLAGLHSILVTATAALVVNTVALVQAFCARTVLLLSENTSLLGDSNRQ